MSRHRRTKRPTPGRSRRPRLNTRTWTRLSDKQLLNVRLCDLDLSIKGAEIETDIHPNENHTIDGSNRYLDFKYTRINPSAGGP